METKAVEETLMQRRTIQKIDQVEARKVTPILARPETSRPFAFLFRRPTLSWNLDVGSACLSNNSVPGSESLADKCFSTSRPTCYESQRTSAFLGCDPVIGIPIRASTNHADAQETADSYKPLSAVQRLSMRDRLSGVSVLVVQEVLYHLDTRTREICNRQRLTTFVARRRPTSRQLKARIQLHKKET